MCPGNGRGEWGTKPIIKTRKVREGSNRAHYCLKQKIVPKILFAVTYTVEWLRESHGLGRQPIHMGLRSHRNPTLPWPFQRDTYPKDKKDIVRTARRPLCFGAFREL